MLTYDLGQTQVAFNQDLYCGDLSHYWEQDNKLYLMMCDGIGHGEKAQEASYLAKDYINDHLSESIQSIVIGCDQALQDGRGVVLCLMVIDLLKNELSYASIGNIDAQLIYTNKKSRLPNDPGFLGGGRLGRFETITVSLTDCLLLIMSTDGIDRQMNVTESILYEYPNAQSIADHLLNKWRSGKDDSGILVCKFGSRIA